MVKFKTLQDKDNPLLNRKDIMVSFDHAGEATPKSVDMANKIAESFKTKLENVEMVYAFTEKGLPVTKVKARIWKDGVPKKLVKEKKSEKPAEASGDSNEA